ncbi:hypothetical protein PtrM4_088720 [Pyrenophora tritici-repentis]|uniref:Uncharacterized protein n=1 Tax=Pyrenophora tritici-repentis TaxID=45151 RepID=A0A834VRE2_9PLEO|nr:hypothetical protein PtrM4_088720 [Pyrenophora tritici-repentis]
MWTSNNPKLLLFTISGLLTTAFVNAQNSSCGSQRQEFRAVNSTGQQEFTWNSSYAGDDPWYVSVLVGPPGPKFDDRFDIRGNAYISVPGNVPNNTKICNYRYQSINATLESGGENSCSGVISSDCMDHLNKALLSPAFYCPSSDTGSTSEEFKKACPMLSGGSHSLYFVDMANSTCAYTDMPEVQIPDNYNTFRTATSVEVASNIDENVTTDQIYDLMTRQTIPVVLLGRFADPESNLVQSSVEFC